jgi:hypothetical protein
MENLRLTHDRLTQSQILFELKPNLFLDCGEAHWHSYIHATTPQKCEAVR